MANPPISSYGPTNSDWPLDTTSSATLALSDGRQLGYAEYGNPTGQPIVYLHGWPSSRIEGAALHQTASKVGARIVAVDRPGFGWSSPHRERTILTHAEDVKALTDHLELQRYGVLGISGGGPYALACARSLPSDRLRAVSIVCGLGSPDMGYAGMNWGHWAGWTFAGRWFPGLLRWWFSRQTEARLDLGENERFRRFATAFDKQKATMNPKDWVLFGDKDWRWMRLRVAAETYRQGMAGFSQDFKLLNSDFGFKIEDIRKDLPVQVWHGKLDNFVPPHHGENVAARIGENAILRISDDTHASISTTHKEEYLTELVKAIKG